MPGGLLDINNLNLIGGILAIIFGIIILLKPQILAWLIGIYLIIAGILAIIPKLT